MLPRRAEYWGGTDSLGFPWFWIAFPLTALVVALAFAAWLPGTASGAVDFGWTMYAPLADADEDSTTTFLSDQAAWQLLRGEWARIGYPLLAVLGLTLSSWAWKKGRI
ncbi:Putative membrane protein [Corynebacterium glyciniphilum AJ 3170]|uniref:Putative membrane protein n=1 Tax=Corynebacterium glyciniphilum AJ 3170 TaxID=1404245 RepID=X5E885_9CORY|nr:Putative membrane protein [Corynebacterium glyciniphilum AJ 3170]